VLELVPEALTKWRFSWIGGSETPRIQLYRVASSALQKLKACDIGVFGLYIQTVGLVEYSSRV